ncbi:ferritin-like domain-containing protein [Usnea florida]
MKGTFLIAAFAACAAASPVAQPASFLKKIRQTAPAITDADILNYALTLEHLEDTFYREGLANFTEEMFSAAGFDSTFYANLKEVSSDETTHVAFLTAALTKAGATPVAACNYNFGVTDVKSFIETASILEGVGVSAYLGAAADIMSAAYLTAAGSILTVESRHSSYIRASLGESPFPSPFDVPLTLDEVYTLAAPFITSCPSSNPTLPVKAFPMLTSAPTNGNITAGSEITLLTPGSVVTAADGKSQIYAAFITVTGPVFTPATAVDGGFTLTVPTAPNGTAPISGQTYVVLTGCNTTVTDDTVAAGPAAFEVGPL